jgi:hypothetical protein
MAEIVAHLTNASVPFTGGSPTIDIWRIDTQAQVVTADSMIEVGGGSYSYSFTTSPTLEYTIRVDAGGGTTPGERYVYGAVSGITEARIETDIPAILVDTDTTIPGLITGLNDLSAADAADAVWDELLTSVNHNIVSSAGFRLQNLFNATIAASGTVSDASPTVSSFGTSLTDVDDFWNDTVLVFTSGALNGQARTVSDFTNVGGVVTFDEDTTSAPADTDSFLMMATHVHPITEIAAAVWDEATVDHVVAGSFGDMVRNKLLSVAKFLALK